MSEEGSDAQLTQEQRDKIDRQAAEAVEADRKEDQATEDSSQESDPAQEQYPDPIEDEEGNGT